MIPSIEYPGGDYAIVPGVGIASEGEVRSVLLFHRGALEGVERVETPSTAAAARLAAEDGDVAAISREAEGQPAGRKASRKSRR